MLILFVPSDPWVWFFSLFVCTTVVDSRFLFYSYLFAGTDLDWSNKILIMFTWLSKLPKN